MENCVLTENIAYPMDASRISTPSNCSQCLFNKKMSKVVMVAKVVAVKGSTKWIFP